MGEDIDEFDESAAAEADGIIIGAPTWNTGADEARSGTGMDDFLADTLPNINVKGKKVAIFGCGDQQSYSEYYCDAAGEIYDKFTEAEAQIYGMTATDGYDHESSKAEVDGKFVGLLFDEDNQSDMSEGRAEAWVEQLKSEGFF